MAAALLLSALHIHNYPILSPIDEVNHFDSVVKLSDGEMVRRGDLLGSAALHAMACRSIDAPDYTPPPCVPDNVPVAFSNMNISYMHPPLYYASTGLVARALDSVGIAPNLLVGARMVNALWFAIGLLLLYGVMGELGVTGCARAAAALLPALIPFVVYQSATVTNDVTRV